MGVIKKGKKVVYRRDIVDRETGEIRSVDSVEYKYEDKKFGFVKLYWDSLWEMRLGVEVGVLVWLCKSMEYMSGDVYIGGVQLSDISKHLNCSVRTIKRILGRMLKEGLIEKRGVHTYRVRIGVIEKGRV